MRVGLRCFVLSRRRPLLRRGQIYLSWVAQRHGVVCPPTKRQVHGHHVGSRIQHILNMEGQIQILAEVGDAKADRHRLEAEGRILWWGHQLQWMVCGQTKMAIAGLGEPVDRRMVARIFAITDSHRPPDGLVRRLSPIPI